MGRIVKQLFLGQVYKTLIHVLKGTYIHICTEAYLMLSVQYKMVSMRSGKSISDPPRLSLRSFSNIAVSRLGLVVGRRFDSVPASAHLCLQKM